MRGRPTSSCRRPVERLSIAPSRIGLAKLEAKLVGEMDAHFRLKDRLEPVAQDARHHRDRLSAGARAADRQRPGGGHAPADPDPVVLLRARRHRRPARDRREGQEPGEPRPRDPGRPDHDARQADVAGPGHPGADPEGVRLEGLQHRDHEERPARGEPGVQGVDLHVCARLERARPSTTRCARRSSNVPRRGLPETVRMRHDEHYVEALAASAGAPIGRMVPIEQIDPNPTSRAR